MTDDRMIDDEIRDAMSCCMMSECFRCPKRFDEDCENNLIAQFQEMLNRDNEQLEAAITSQYNLINFESNKQFISEIKSIANRLFNYGGKQMTDVMQDLLIDFDEMGFAPTTACPNPDKYACEWKEKLVSEINCLQEQLEAAANGQETLQKALAEKDREVAELNSDLKLLKNNHEHLKTNFDETVEKNKRLRDKAIRLTAEKDQLIKTFGECQAEAVREFAERLKQRCSANSDINYYILKKLVDNLVKEMVGDAE